ncbi:MAG TPA: P1 family peptidase [Acidimicrobiales bacterium]|nr:P1 family peptidase [Acidimicrobiales bacterium]
MPVIEIGDVAVRGPKNDLSDVEGIRVGHHQRIDEQWLSGTTVILPPSGTVGSVDVRGGGPSTRETDALSPTTLVTSVDAVCLSGGSSYGLAAADGVMRLLEERRTGLRVGPDASHVVPIVPAACLFDIVGGGAFTSRPDASFGRAALEAADMNFAQGTVGAGTGARAGGLKGGIGSASVVLENGVTVAAMVALNSGGNIVDPRTGELYGRRYGLSGEFDHLSSPSAQDVELARQWLNGPRARNTVLMVVATDAALTKSECCRIAMAAHDGLARAVTPVHCMTDGDVVFSLATGAVELPQGTGNGVITTDSSRPEHLDVLMAAGANAVTRAVVHAALNAAGVTNIPSYLDVYPSARR